MVAGGAGPARASEGQYLPEKDQQARLIRFPPAQHKKIDSALPEKKFLLQIASDTWGYFRDVTDRETGLPLDNVVIGSTYTKVGSFTSTTNIGLYLMCVVSAVDFGFISSTEAVHRLRLVMESLNKLETWENQPYNFYDTIDLTNSGKYVSSVDNGWLAAGLIVARQAYPDEFGAEMDMWLDRLDFSKLYDPRNAQLFGGYDAGHGKHSENHYGLLCTEPRLTSYIAIAKGDVPREHWFRLFRTLPKDWDWQNQTPRGVERKYSGWPVFNGHYRYGRIQFVPSWGGSMFEFLMPTLVLDEQRLAPEGLGLNNQRILSVQIHYALMRKRYPVWGMSPCAIPEETLGYREYGVTALGSKGYEDDGVVTPHATFLALAVDPAQAVKNLRRLAKIPGIYGEFGFYDSVNVRTGQVSPRLLCLDQGMSFIALANYLNDGAVRKRFHSYPPIQEQEDLLTVEKFF